MTTCSLTPPVGKVTVVSKGKKKKKTCLPQQGRLRVFHEHWAMRWRSKLFYVCCVLLLLSFLCLLCGFIYECKIFEACSLAGWIFCLDSLQSSGLSGNWREVEACFRYTEPHLDYGKLNTFIVCDYYWMLQNNQDGGFKIVCNQDKNKCVLLFHFSIISIPLGLKLVNISNMNMINSTLLKAISQQWIYYPTTGSCFIIML